MGLCTHSSVLYLYLVICFFVLNAQLNEVEGLHEPSLLAWVASLSNEASLNEVEGLHEPDVLLQVSEGAKFFVPLGDSESVQELGGMPVSCGGHGAKSCGECPRNHGAKWCNGDCEWTSGACSTRRAGECADAHPACRDWISFGYSCSKTTISLKGRDVPIKSYCRKSCKKCS